MRKEPEALGMQPLPEGFLCDPRLPMALPGIRLPFPFSSLCFGWMCEGFSTAGGVVVPLHNDEDHDLAVIFHDLPVGDRPLVRTPLQKVLVRSHFCSWIPCEKGFLIDAVFHCFGRYMSCFSMCDVFAF